MYSVRRLIAIGLYAGLAAAFGCSSKSSPDHDAATPAVDTDAGASSGAVVGSFTVSLVAPTDTETSGHTTVVGKVYDGVTPAQIIWEQQAQAGGCVLSTPKVPFCSDPCGGSAVCAADDDCVPYPTAHTVGTVHVSGVKTSTGATTFSMDPVANTYQPTGGVSLPFDAFSEGDPIQFAAAGGAYKAFTLSTQGIAPLDLNGGDVALAKGQPVDLSWTAAGAAIGSSVHVKLDISHHGGSKGMIECDGDDDGSLEISADLISSLLDLGVAGFPTIIVTRHNDGSAAIAPGTVTLSVTSQVERAVTVPGLASCSADSDCPSGQKCQSDLSCK